jgi:glucose/arabinose dehydrogenase
VQRSEHHSFRAVTVAEGLENAWGMAFLPGGDILVTEKPGRLRIIRQGKLDPQPIEGVPTVFHKGQGGLLDVALHPDFASSRLVYLSYSKPVGEGQNTTAVVRGRLEGNRLTGVEEVFEAKARTDRTLHFGSRLAFGRDGNLFVTVGDRGDRTDLGERQNAQNLTNHAGKVLRITPEGKVPQDNPFVGHPTALPEIYSYGNRNPQGLTIHPVTGEVWAVEHGPRGGDEVNLIRPGRNYGWPVITYGINYNGTPITDITAREEMEQPLHYWVPSIATSGLTIYNGDKFPEWKGDVFVGGMAGMQLARVEFDGTRPVREETLLKNVRGRIRDVRTGPDGYLYLLTDSPEGELVRLEPAGE